MGSPKVFQTAPPQPASKARITCTPQLAGGPDASQNGLGQRMPPANTVVRSAMLGLQIDWQVGDLPHDLLQGYVALSIQPFCHCDSSAFSFGHCVHYFPAAV